MYAIGIDVGYSAIKISLLTKSREVVDHHYCLHKGHIRETLIRCIEQLGKQYSLKEIGYVGITGSESQILKSAFGNLLVNEVTSLVEGAKFMNPEVKSIIEIGGQSAKYISGLKDSDHSRMRIAMNSSCAAGTGSFLEEQMSRLNLSIEDYSSHVLRAESIPRIAGRCSVFAKTDITHHQQEGVPVDDILLGLAYAVIRNFRGAVMKRTILEKPVMLVGGVMHNEGIRKAIVDVMELSADDYCIPESFANVLSTGAALQSIAQKQEFSLISLYEMLINDDPLLRDNQDHIVLESLSNFGNGDTFNKHDCAPQETNSISDCYLGIDIGSTSTNLVLMDSEQRILDFCYLKTYGNPIQAVKTGLQQLYERNGTAIRVRGACTTGSGRYLIAQLIGADLIKDEITAQAKAAVKMDPDVDTIFEIGGQDSKFISLQNGAVVDFQMNKICAAGTGSFIEEQTKKFSIPLDEFGDRALQSCRPSYLGERCTVFIETCISERLSQNVPLNDIASGLCYSIVKNYLSRVVGQKRVGNKIFLQGGIAYNQGVINAFRSVTGKEIIVPPFFSVTGAYGAALMAQEEMENKRTAFKGFAVESSEEFMARLRREKTVPASKSSFDQSVDELIFADYDATMEPDRKTVGIPRALFTFGMFPMFNAFFKELGFNVLMSEPTSEKTIELAQQYSLDETCYPVKLVNGHVAELVAKKVDYIFFPDLYTVDHPDSQTRQNYGCAYMQLAFKVMRQAMRLDEQGIELLSPTIGFNLGPEFMQQSFARLGTQLGRTKEQTNKALQKGMQAFLAFEHRMEQHSQKMMESLPKEEKVFVLISKIYGVADPVLNLGLPGKLKEMGYPVLSFYDLPDGDIHEEYPNMFWPFGQHILEPAQLVKEHPNMYAIYLSHHGCGPDSVLSHYMREIMEEKPYLHIEVDEHSSSVGVITRIEAFVNSLANIKTIESKPFDEYVNQIEHCASKLDFSLTRKQKLLLPNLHPYSPIWSALLKKEGFQCEVLPESNDLSMELGRRHTITEEYYSFTVLMGDIIRKLQSLGDDEANVSLLIPQNEGAEANGQYARLVRTELDAHGFSNVDVVAPFSEDWFQEENERIDKFFLGVLAGDLVRIEMPSYREECLQAILSLIKQDQLTFEALEKMAGKIHRNWTFGPTDSTRKRVMGLGEIMVLYNDFLNDGIFVQLEKQGHRVFYAPLSEYLWFIANDYMRCNGNKLSSDFQKKLYDWQKKMELLSEKLGNESPFASNLDLLVTTANQTVGYYAGNNGRYREAKRLIRMTNVSGFIHVASMYENTAITLNVLHQGWESDETLPVLNMTFDGNRNENDRIKIESFMYYL